MTIQRDVGTPVSYGHMHSLKLFSVTMNAFLACQTTLLKVVEDWKQKHILIILKLKAYLLSEIACSLMLDYLFSRSQRVKSWNITSEWQEIIKGVSQDSIFWPLIFNFFINDIFTQTSTLINYADDNTLSFQHKTLKLSKIL